jgi:hypothetical protein
MLRASGRGEWSSLVLPTLRIGDRSALRRRRVADRLLGVSRRRRQAGYLALASGFSLLRPMLRRIAALAGTVVLVAATSAYLRFVF